MHAMFSPILAWLSLAAISLTIGPLTMSSLVSSAARADDWPQFRGANSSGVSTATNKLPVEFSLDKNLRWSVELGEGIASPIVVGGRAFATALTGPEQFSVFAFGAADGKPLWRRDMATGPLPPITQPNSQASSTPTADGDRVYVYFSTLGLLAFDAATVELRPSKGSKYLGVTVTVTATSREQLDELYRTLSTHPMVKVVL